LRLSVIHNLKPGTSPVLARELRQILVSHGHTIKHWAGKKDDWKALVRNPAELLVVAGGDGMVGRVLRRSVRNDVPVAILPAGTANNIGRSLGLFGNMRDLVSNWKSDPVQQIDLGIAKGPWGRRWFIEGFGIGVLATAMTRLRGQDKRSRLKTENKTFKLERDRMALRGLAADYPSMTLCGEIDGEPIKGQFLLVEALNTGLVGPALGLAPHASIADGFLDFVLVPADHRDDFLAYLSPARPAGSPLLPAYVQKGKMLKLKGNSHDFHIDDESASPPATSVDGHLDVEIAVDANAVSVLANVPADPVPVASDFEPTSSSVQAGAPSA
jgi:diacylglycerol kinase family enzyme